VLAAAELGDDEELVVVLLELLPQAAIRQPATSTTATNGARRTVVSKMF
jgi:hypothetical protein